MSGERRELALHLRHLAECYGADLPVSPARARSSRAAETVPAARQEGDAEAGTARRSASGAGEERAAPLAVGGPGRVELVTLRAASAAASDESRVEPTAPHAATHATAGCGRADPTAPTAPPVGGASETTAPTLPARPAGDPAELLATLRAEVVQCRKCRLCEGRTNVVFGDGNPRARVAFVGEAPGFTEDQQGLPFVGRAGQLLTKIIENAMGLRRAEVWIGNVNKCRPPENREPAPDEVAACLPYLREQLSIIRPEVIVALGKVAAWNLLGLAQPMRALRGRNLEWNGIPVVVTWHPAYLLRNPAAKAETWDDIKRVNRRLGLPEVPSKPQAG
jgi:DNA polymerase